MFRFIQICLLTFAIVCSIATQLENHLNTAPLEADAYRLSMTQEIAKIMDSSADPCYNYYQFACGNWHKHYPATESQPETVGIRNAEKEFQHLVSILMNTTDAMDTASERKMKTFYKSCLNVPEITMSDYRKSLKTLIKEFGKMPALEGKNWQQEHFDWLQTVGEISNKYGVSIFFKYTIVMSIDITSNTLQLGPQMFALTDTSGPGIVEYKTTVEDYLVVYLGVKRSIAKVAASNIAKFEAALVKAVDKAKDDWLPMAIKDLQTPSLDFQRLMNITFGYIPSGMISIVKTEYFPEFVNIMKKTPTATVANYIFYHLLREFKIKLNADNRSRLCAKQIQTGFPLVLSKMLYRVYRLQDKVAEYRELWQDIVATLQDALESDRLSWYDDANREFALEKLHLLKLHVTTFEDYNLEADYADLNLNASCYVQNVQAIKSFRAREKRATLDMRTDVIADNPNFLTPLYNRNINSVIFPISTLLSSFYVVPFMPKVLKYARLGYIFGHELSHGFSGNSRLYDRLGHYLGTIGDIEQDYAERKNCFYDQYQNYEQGGKTSNRQQDQNQSENIADIAGVALSYQAYSRWLASGERTKEELIMETLPHLNYTHKQLFFIYYSQTWCSDTTPLFDKLSLDDKHSLSSLRAVVPLTNFDEFSKAFNCPLGSPMNPENKCKLI